MPVAMGDTVTGPLPRVGPDLLGGLGFDQLLQRPLGELADKVSALPNAERVEQVRNGRSERAIGVISFGVHLVGTHRASRRWLT